LDQGSIAARGHVVDNGAGRPLDIGGDLTLGAEKSAKTLGENRAVSVQANGHGGFLGNQLFEHDLIGKPVPLFPIMPGVGTYAQWRGGPWPSTLIPAVPAWSRDPSLRGSRCYGRYLTPALSPIGRGVWVPAPVRSAH